MSNDELSADKKTSQTKPLSKQGRRLPQYLAALSVCLGAISTGAVLGWTGNITEELKRGEFNDIEMNDFNLQKIGSYVALGAMIMCVPSGIICEKLGCRLVLLIITIPFISGWLTIVFANSVVMIYIGRFLTGMACGLFLLSAPLYTTEIAEKEIRGLLGTLGTIIPLGIMIANVIGYMVNPKIYTVITATFPLLFAVTFLFQPETPVYYIKRNKEAEARVSLIRLRGNSYDVDAELEDIKATIEKNEKNQISFKDSLKKKSTIKAAIICFSLMFFQQASGTSAVIYYTSNIFKSSGSELDPRLATVIIGVIQTIAGIVSFLTIDKLGRKVLLIGSAFFMAIGLIILAIFLTLSERWLVPSQTIMNLSFMPLLGLILYIIAFRIGLGSIPWVIVSELFPPEIKGVASAAANTFNWLIVFLVSNFYFDLKQAIGGDGTFYIFSAICIVGAIFIYLVVPETKGKSLSQIQKELSGERSQLEGVDNKSYNL